MSNGLVFKWSVYVLCFMCYVLCTSTTTTVVQITACDMPGTNRPRLICPFHSPLTLPQKCIHTQYANYWAPPADYHFSNFTCCSMYYIVMLTVCSKFSGVGDTSWRFESCRNRLRQRGHFFGLGSQPSWPSHHLLRPEQDGLWPDPWECN